MNVHEIQLNVGSNPNPGRIEHLGSFIENPDSGTKNRFPQETTGGA
jgi:hypothetical protein